MALGAIMGRLNAAASENSDSQDVVRAGFIIFVPSQLIGRRLVFAGAGGTDAGH
jgi:hypothetical protein